MATQESNPFEYLPHDLITEILSRLQVKSLLRSRCVSKSWLSHISSPEFQTTYLEVSSTTRPRLVFGSDTALYTCSLSHIFDEHPCVDYAPLDFASRDPYDKIQIVGSCNGLVCLVFLRTGCITVWNPATRKYRQLPPWQCSFLERYGFGYDASSDDYKVVHIVHDPYSIPYSRTYSLRNNSWKKSCWPRDMMTFGRSGMFMNGAIHWIVHYNDNGDTVWAVVAQSLATGDFVWTVALPLPRNESRVMSAFLEVLGERLCVCFECCLQIEFWLMEEYGVEESWSQVFCLDSYNMRMDSLLVTEKGLLSTSVDSRLMAHILFENREFFELNNNYVTTTTYAESFVNPNLVQLVEASGYLNFSI